MWSPWMLSRFNLHRPDLVNDNITLEEIVFMWDAVKEPNG